MNTNGYIPQSTIDKLSSPAPKGTRHQTLIDVALPLIGNGMERNTVFGILRGKFEPDVTDNEINGVISWCENKHPTPTTGTSPHPFRPYTKQVPTQKPIERTPSEQVAWWTSDTRMTEEEIAALSPTPIPDSQDEACCLAISSLYSDESKLNIVCQYTVDGDKTRPSGSGKILPRDEWCDFIRKNSVPHSKAGAWFRINPCANYGSGKEGAITDADIVEFKYLLLESDSVPIAFQLALFYKLKLPISAILISGGKSAHAWLKVSCQNGDQYHEIGKRFLSALKPFGIDQANSNPSRLSRLPGAIRTIGAAGDGVQRLIWLNPNASALSKESIAEWEKSLEFPAISDRPLRLLAADAISRYEDMYRNQGRLGVTTGIPELDAISGGFKPGHTIVVAGQTGGGKSTYALHILKSALDAGVGVLLFSLEMDKEEIFDLLVSNECQIDRNKFNTGKFGSLDFDSMKEKIGSISKLPLYIEDSALSGVDQIRTRVLQLKSASKIGLVIVDYIQFVNPGLTRDSREQQVAAISHSLRALAREVKLPFVILSQLNDEGKLRESRVIAHNANIVMVVETEIETFKIKVVKGRGIPTGQYQLLFNRRFAKLQSSPID